MPNPNIAEAGKATRFQKGNAAAKDRRIKPSLRNSLLRLGSIPLTLPSKGSIEACVEQLIPHAVTLNDFAAIALLKRALKSTRAWKRLTRIVDGPAPIAAQQNSNMPF